MRDLLIEACVLDRRGDLRRQQRQGLHHLRGEGVDLFALQIDHADHLVFEHQWDGHFGSNSIDDRHIEIVEVSVTYEDRPLRLRRSPHNAHAELHVVPLNPLVVPDAEVVLQHRATFFQ